MRADLDPKKYTIRTVPALLKRSKAWREYEESSLPLREAINRIGKTKIAA